MKKAEEVTDWSLLWLEKVLFVFTIRLFLFDLGCWLYICPSYILHTAGQCV